MRAKLNVHSDFMMVLTLFVAFRLMMVLLFTPTSFLTLAYTDYTYYYDMAALSDQGRLPWIHFWFEYPPVFPYLAIGVYKITRLANENLAYFSRTLSLVLLPFEITTLASLYQIARRLYDQVVAVRVAWIYSALLLPIFFWQYSLDTMIVGLTLLALASLLENRKGLSAIALGIAIGVKYYPAFLLATVWRFASSRKNAVVYTLIVAAVVALIFLPFFILSFDFALASFRALLSSSAWETVWALIDGNISYGDVGGLARHFDLALAGVPTQNLPRLPMGVTLILFGALFLFVFTRPLDRNNPRHLLVFTGIVLALFHLWSKGWSPQWVTLVLPFLLLLYPNWRGVLLCLALSFTALLDWPLAFAMGSPPVYVIGVLVRTGLFILVGVDLYLELSKASGR